MAESRSLARDGLFLSLDSLLGDRTENGEDGLGGLGGRLSGRIKEFLVCQVLSSGGVIKGLVLEEYTETIRVPSFPLTDTLVSSLNGLHSQGSRNLELTRTSHHNLNQ